MLYIIFKDFRETDKDSDVRGKDNEREWVFKVCANSDVVISVIIVKEISVLLRELIREKNVRTKVMSCILSLNNYFLH